VATEEERAVEAIVMVSDRPVEPGLLAQLLELPPARIEDICDRLAESYAAEDRGFQLVRVAGGYRYQSHPDLAPYVERFVLEGQSARLSAAALETLAIVAYKQPVSRAQVAAIRGVNADAVIRTLQTRGFIQEVGRDPGPGQATLYGTTQLLLEKLGLDRIEQLPPLAQFVPGPEIMDALERSLRADPVPDMADPEAPDPGAPDPGAPDPGAPDPGAPDPDAAAEPEPEPEADPEPSGHADPAPRDPEA
jgi:segregation and condensation protein B